MRKLFWCCAALALVGAGGVYLVSSYACRNPHSPLGRFVVATYSRGLRYSTVFQVGRLLREREAASAVKMGGRAAGQEESEPADLGDSGPVPIIPLDGTTPIPAVQGSEPWDGQFNRLPGRITIGEADEPSDTPSAAGPFSDLLSQSRSMVWTDSQMTSIGQETGEGTSFMPPCAEESAPARMPRAPEDEVIDSLLGFFGKGHGEENSEEPTPTAKPADGKAPRSKATDPLDSGAGKLPPAAVDTMEFRPSDAKDGEFDRIPY